MDKTQYRIIPKTTFIGDMYLQFKRDKEWCYIPEYDYAYILGRYLNQSDCPTRLPIMGGADFLHSFHGQEGMWLIPFSKRWENIELYFYDLRSKHEKYISDEKSKKINSRTIYL